MPSGALALGVLLCGVLGSNVGPSLGLALPLLAFGVIRTTLWFRVTARRRITHTDSELEVGGSRIPMSGISSLYIHRGSRRPEWAKVASLPRIDVLRIGQVPVDSGALLACTPSEVEALVAAVGRWASAQGIDWQASPPAGRWGIW